MEKINQIEKSESELLELNKYLGMAFDAINMRQSTYLLEHAVVGAHDKPERQWWQAILELRTCVKNINTMKLDQEEAELEIEILEEDLHKLKPIQMKLKMISIERQRLRLADIIEARDMNVRYAWNCYKIARMIENKCHDGKPYSMDELEAAEPEYWRRRAIRQSWLQMGPGREIGPGNMDLLLQMSRTIGEEKELIPGDKAEVIQEMLDVIIKPSPKQLKGKSNGSRN